MTDRPAVLRKETLDKDLDKFVSVEEAAGTLARSLVGPGLSLVFLALVALFAAIITAGEPRALVIILAAAIGGYMALNIGANDVANNVGPAVGAQAMTMGMALAIAATFEAAGALIAGADVVNTISRDIIDPATVASSRIFIWAMMAALLSSALWINVATMIGAPVSTTHAVVGGVLGAGIAAVGFSAVNWLTMGAIAMSWVISPVLGAVFAAAMLAFIKTTIIYTDDKIAAARRWVPVLIAVMTGTFAAYLALKGLRQLIRLSGTEVILVGLAVGLVVWPLSRALIRRQSQGLENRNQSLRRLFHLPLIMSSALLSFAHGANDVANAVGPLAAIVHAVGVQEVGNTVTVPLWVLFIGAVGISLGLVLFGPKLIRMVGQQITRLNPMRAYCVALSAAITVIVASWFGLPVSSTHIAVGAVFGVGFFREWYTANSSRRRAYIERKLERERQGRPQRVDDNDEDEVPARNGNNNEITRRRLVRRAHVRTIVAAWVVTVPISAVLAAALFLGLNAL